MFPDSIRESPTPNEASQVKTYYNPTGTSTQVETGKSRCKLTGANAAKGGSHIQHSDSQNHEVIALSNNVQKSVLINTSNEATETTKEGSEVQHL